MKKLSKVLLIFAVCTVLVAVTCAYAGGLRSSDAPTVSVTMFRR